MSENPSDPDQHALKQDTLTNISPTLEVDKYQGTETLLSSPESILSSPHSDKPDDIQHGSLERIPTARTELPNTHAAQRTTTDNGPMYSVFTKSQKIFIVFMASWAGFFSPVSGQIYFPALNALARDLHVSNSLINLTLTSYMVCYASYRSILLD